jgi:hypothetical protein
MKNTNNNTIQEPQLLWLKHFSAGVCAGGASRTCTAPIDRLRTFFQGNLKFHSCFLSSILSM